MKLFDLLKKKLLKKQSNVTGDFLLITTTPTTKMYVFCPSTAELNFSQQLNTLSNI